MAERKATNKYYPPDWDPSKGSINTYRKSHPLRERAKKLHLGILVIRFEMPYNIWCEGCKNHIGTGVRYNAEKSKVGMYYTTPVYKFRMKCHLCDNYIEMQTDPGNLDYKILSGASRQERRWDPTENGQVVPEDKDVSKQMATDPMFKLDHMGDDVKKMKDLQPVMDNLEKFQRRKKDDYELNSLLRRKFRTEKKERKELEEKDQLLKSKAALSIKLLPESTYDMEIAQLLRLQAPIDIDTKRRLDRADLISRPLFNQDGAGPSRKRESNLEKNLFRGKVPRSGTETLTSSLRKALRKPPKKLYGFDDAANLPGSSADGQSRTVEEDSGEEEEEVAGEVVGEVVGKEGGGKKGEVVPRSERAAEEAVRTSTDNLSRGSSEGSSRIASLIDYSDSDKDSD